MSFDTLNAISPIDGRYRNKVAKLADYFSEKALIQHRVEVEVRYFQALCQLPLQPLQKVDKHAVKHLNNLFTNFSNADAEKVKEIEKTTNHDVKSVEYFIKDAFDSCGLSSYKEFIHFGLTSQDINNTGIPLLLKRALNDVVFPAFKELTNALSEKVDQWKDIPMLAKTHGQPASPTKLGKEINVFLTRLRHQIEELKRVPITAKFGGATGNFNAHHVAYPETDWHAFGNMFLEEKLGLKRSEPTTQIEHYDYLATLFDALKRINTILIDFSRDVWQYVAMNYFTQKIKGDEIGSSAMPHKINPIDFENAEGNLGIANALFEHLSAKLPISRLQRDLTDSTALRNIGVPIAHTYLSLQSLTKGLSRLQHNESAIRADLENNWSVITEAIQTILRREGFPKPYEVLLAFTRKNAKITESSIKKFISELKVSEKIKDELLKITPFNYTGS